MQPGLWLRSAVTKHAAPLEEARDACDDADLVDTIQGVLDEME